MRVDRWLILLVILLVLISSIVIVGAENSPNETQADQTPEIRAEDEYVDVIVNIKPERRPRAKQMQGMGFKGMDKKERRKAFKAMAEEIKLEKQDIIRESRREFLQNIRIQDKQVKRAYSNVNTVVMRIKKSEMHKLQSDPNVESFGEGVKFDSFLSNSVPLTEADVVHGLQYSGYNITGTGETVCVIDTGIDYTHPDLGGCTQGQMTSGTCPKIPGGYDYVNNDNDPADDRGHGTHVAGIVAASGTLTGIAPDAKLLALKTLNENGSDPTGAWVLAGIDFCVNNSAAYNVSVITMSLGTPEFNNTLCDADNRAIMSAMRDAINTAHGLGITVMAAAGNYFSTGAPVYGVAFPACLTNVTAVGATHNTGASPVDGIASFSQRGNTLDLLAPGKFISSTVPPMSACTGVSPLCDDSTYKSIQGTSQATPHVAGAVALLQQYSKIRNGHTLTPAEIKTMLQQTGKSITDTGYSGLTFSRINISAAINSMVFVNLQIYDQGDSQGGSLATVENAQIMFFANYTNTSGNTAISTANCTAAFDGSNLTLVYDSATGLYNATRNFTVSATYSYTTACAAQGYDSASDSGSVAISDVNDAPAASITAPANASSHYNQSTITFTGTGTDEEDGQLSGASLVWWSSLDGSLGTGTELNVSTLTVGNHTVVLNATDSGSLVASDSITIEITPRDDDSDGLYDNVDTLFGNADDVDVTGISSVILKISGNSTVDGVSFSGKQSIEIWDNLNILLNISYNFSQGQFNMSRVKLVVNSSNGLVVDLDNQQQETKTMYISDPGYTSLCVKDAVINSIEDISVACTGASEFDFTSCIGNSSGVTIAGITCYDLGNNFRLENLNHSGARGSGSSGGGSSSGGSSGYSGSGGGGGGGGSYARAMSTRPTSIKISSLCANMNNSITVFNAAGASMAFIDVRIYDPNGTQIFKSKTSREGYVGFVFPTEGTYTLEAKYEYSLLNTVRVMDCSKTVPFGSTSKSKEEVKEEEVVEEVQSPAAEEELALESEKEEVPETVKEVEKKDNFLLGTLLLLIAIGVVVPLGLLKHYHPKHQISKYLPNLHLHFPEVKIPHKPVDLGKMNIKMILHKYLKGTKVKKKAKTKPKKVKIEVKKEVIVKDRAKERAKIKRDKIKQKGLAVQKKERMRQKKARAKAKLKKEKEKERQMKKLNRALRKLNKQIENEKN
ncbi:MAG: S8 family serine peptidase [Nanoarchaeota archaeon]|nr:S8 family serine peptidase [Nanoarchaeota archaeon]